MRWAESTGRLPVQAPAAVPEASRPASRPIRAALLDDLVPPRRRLSLIGIGVGAAVVVGVAVILVLTRGGGGAHGGADEVSLPTRAQDAASDSGLVDGVPAPSPPGPSPVSAPPADAATDAAVADVDGVPPPTMDLVPSSAPAPAPALVPVTTATPAPAPATPTTLASLAPVVAIPPHFAVYSNGTVYLQGAVADRATADALVAKAAAVVGAGNVVDEYVIDPRAPRTSDGRVIVDEAVLFESGSTRIGPEFAQIIDLAVVALTLNPQATLLIEGHTDSLGTDRSNLRLSQRRADSIVRHMVGQGIDRARLSAVGRGESVPVAPNETPEGMARNRRIEVTFLGLLA